MTSERLILGSAAPKFNLRMPPELRLTLAAEAARNGRSLNAEIVYRLLKSLETYRQL